jgi:hypothetical protein
VGEHFKLTAVWEAKTNAAALRFLLEQEATPEQIEYAANIWRTDKLFNWQPPNVKGIREHWTDLVSDFEHAPKGYDGARTPKQQHDALAGTTTAPAGLKPKLKTRTK